MAPLPVIRAMWLPPGTGRHPDRTARCRARLPARAATLLATALRPACAVLLVAVLLCTAPAPSHGHVFLDRAEPAPGSAVQQSPPAIRLRFTAPVDARASRLTVRGTHGGVVAGRSPRASATDRDVVLLPLPPLPPGAYTFRWTVVGADGHRSEGDYTFTVRAAK